MTIDKTISIQSQYSDFDFYAHVNSGRYLDHVESALFKVLKEEVGKSFKEIVEKQKEKSLRNVKIQFKRPVLDLDEIRVKLAISEDHSRVNFSIFLPGAEKPASLGALEFGEAHEHGGSLASPSDETDPPFAVETVALSYRPIVYDLTWDLRMMDIGADGRIRPSAVLETVNSARYAYVESQFDMKIFDLTKQGVGFYLVESNFEILRRTEPFRKVRKLSYIRQVSGPMLKVAFEIRNESGTHIYARGVNSFVTMDLHAGRPRDLPDSIAEVIFFEKMQTS